MTLKKATLIAASFAIILTTFTSCAPRRRWYSTYTDKKGQQQTEHYNEYKTKWYKKNYHNGNLWK